MSYDAAAEVFSTSNNSKSDAKALKIAQELFNESKKFKETLNDEHDKADRFYEGHQWRTDPQKLKPVKNIVFTIVEAEVPIITDIRPAPEIISSDGEPENDEKAKNLENAVRYVMRKNNFELRLSQAVRTATKTGTGWHYVDWDSDLNGGDGQITIKNIPRQAVFLDPSSTDLDDAGYAVIRIPMRIDDIKRQYPSKAKLIKPENVSFEMYGSEMDGIDPTKRFLNFSASFKEKSDLKNMAVVQETWKRDYSMTKITEEETIAEIEEEHAMLDEGKSPDVRKYENHLAHNEAHNQELYLEAANVLGVSPEEVTDEDIARLAANDFSFQNRLDHIEAHTIMHEQNPKAMRPKYPKNLRLIISVGDVVLYDGGAPVEDGLIPLVPYYCYKDENSPYGTGEIKNIISPQETLNEMDYMELQGLRKNSNSGWVKDDNSGVATDQLHNGQGIIITKKQGTEVRRLDPGTVSPQFQNRKDSDRVAMEMISGIQEATQGRRPTGVTAAKAIEALQQQSIGRIRLKTRYLEASIERLGILVSSRILKYWTTERKLRVQDYNTGEYNNLVFNADEIKDLDYEVRVTTGTMAGSNKEAIFGAMTELLQGGIIDPITFLQVTDLPFKNKLIESANQRDELAQKAQLADQLQAQLDSLTGEMAPTGEIPSEGMPIA